MAAQKDPSPPAATTTPKAEADPEDENWGLHDDEDDDNNRHPPVHKPGEQPITSPYNPPVLPDWGTTYGDWNLEGDEAGGDEDPQDETSYEDLLDQEEAANATTTAAAAATKGEIETATSAAATGSSTEPVTSTPQLPQVPPSKVQSYQPQQQPQHPQQQMQQGGWRGGARGGSREGRPYQRGRGGNMQRGYHPRMMEQQQGMYMPNGGMMPTGFPPHMPAAASRGRGGRKIYVNPAKLDRLPPDLAQAARLILLQQQSQASGGGDAAAAGGYDPDSPGLNGDYRGIPPMGMPHMGPMGMPMGMPMMPGFGGGSSIRGRGGRGGGRYPPNSYGSHGMNSSPFPNPLALQPRNSQPFKRPVDSLIDHTQDYTDSLHKKPRSEPPPAVSGGSDMTAPAPPGCTAIISNLGSRTTRATLGGLNAPNQRYIKMNPDTTAEIGFTDPESAKIFRRLYNKTEIDGSRVSIVLQ